jgi:hypothetical protein
VGVGIAVCVVVLVTVTMGRYIATGFNSNTIGVVVGLGVTLGVGVSVGAEVAAGVAVGVGVGPAAVEAASDRHATTDSGIEFSIPRIKFSSWIWPSAAALNQPDSLGGLWLWVPDNTLLLRDSFVNRAGFVRGFGVSWVSRREWGEPPRDCRRLW